ncbi:MAG: c-type cytochrome [Chthoniobacteraceae bacterium]
MALRDNLLVADGFNLAAQIEAKFPEQGERLADGSLAVTLPDSAAFLLTHLERTKLETPRAGEYLKHAVLYLPAEKLDAVAKLVAQVGNAPLPRKLALATNLTDAAKQRGGALPGELTAWSQGVLVETLASNNDELTKPAIAAVRDLKLEAKLAPLAKIARDETRDNALRLAALEAAANLPASIDLLLTTFTDSRHMILRKRAAELLAQRGSDLQSGADPARITLIPALAQAPWELTLAISAALAKSDAGATALLDAIESGKAPARVLVNKSVVGSLIARPKPLQERAKSLTKDVPPEDARLDLLIAQRAKDFTNTKASREHGAQIFQQQCAVCHRFRNAGGNVGPNLDGVSARGPQRLIEDILDPNRNVDPGFRQTIVETANGQTLVGNNVREQGDVLTLTDATGKQLTTAKSAIKSRTTLPLSLMPPVFETTLPAADFNDLLAHLLSAAE